MKESWKNAKAIWIFRKELMKNLQNLKAEEKEDCDVDSAGRIRPKEKMGHGPGKAAMLSACSERAFPWRNGWENREEWLCIS